MAVVVGLVGGYFVGAVLYKVIYSQAKFEILCLLTFYHPDSIGMNHHLII